MTNRSCGRPGTDARLPALAVFAVAFLLIPYGSLDGWTLMPGDPGDNRLNNYFLENIYRFLAGSSESLVHLGFFHPFPYVLGFSDNLFGSSPFYLLPRVIVGKADVAFQAWYLFGFVLNYASCYYVLERLRLGGPAAILGALLFTFAMPVTAQIGHAQLHYRFAIPMAIWCFVEFLESGRPSWFRAALFWAVWQFYCTIYMGFFLMFFLAAMVLAAALSRMSSGERPDRAVCRWWTGPGRDGRLRSLFALCAAVAALSLLFYPYLRVTELYDASRGTGAINGMLPRVQSYFLADGSYLWSSRDGFGIARILEPAFASLPMRHEHQLFVGIVGLALAVAGYLFVHRAERHRSLRIIVGALGLCLVFTVSIEGLSPWQTLTGLPLFSAIRAVSRIVLLFLFPLACLLALAAQLLARGSVAGRRAVAVVFLPLLLFESAFVRVEVSDKALWRSGIERAESLVPEDLPEDAILFFAQPTGSPVYAELDAMWAAMRRGVPTLNGYSGWLPDGMAPDFGNDCGEYPRRLQAYLAFSGRPGDLEGYRRLASRVVPLGFSNCDPAWRRTPPDPTMSSAAPPA